MSVAQVVTAPAVATSPQIAIFDGVSGELVRLFAAGVKGGATVAVGDVNGDGLADIIVGAARGSTVNVFDSQTKLEAYTFNAFPAPFTGGVAVFAADYDGEGVADIFVAPTNKGNIAVFSGPELLTTLPEFYLA